MRDVSLTIKSRRQSRDRTELIGKSALIAKPEHERNIRNRLLRVRQFMHRSLDTGANHKLLYGHAENLPEKALQLALRKSRMPGNFREHESVAKMLTDKIRGFSNCTEMAQHLTPHFEELDCPNQTDDFPSRITQRIFVSDRPITKTIFVHAHFNAVEQRLAMANHPLIVRQEFVCNFDRQVIAVREADNFLF